MKRRNFIKGIVAAGAVLAIAPGIALATPKRKTWTIGIPVPPEMLNIHYHIKDKMGYTCIDVYGVENDPTGNYTQCVYVNGWDYNDRISIRHYPEGTIASGGVRVYWTSWQGTYRVARARSWTMEAKDLIKWL